jgi:hypothetical protein
MTRVTEDGGDLRLGVPVQLRLHARLKLDLDFDLVVRAGHHLVLPSSTAGDPTA